MFLHVLSYRLEETERRRDSLLQIGCNFTLNSIGIQTINIHMSY